MARATINEHPDRGRIEFDLARGVPVRAIAKKYGVNMHALTASEKLPPHLKAAHMGARLKAGADLEKLRLDESEASAAKHRHATRAAVAHAGSGDGRRRPQYGGAALLGAFSQIIELVGQYLGEFAQHQIRTTVSVLIPPEYLEFRAALMGALAPLPRCAAGGCRGASSDRGEAAAADPLKRDTFCNCRRRSRGRQHELEASHAAV